MRYVSGRMRRKKSPAKCYEWASFLVQQTTSQPMRTNKTSVIRSRIRNIGLERS